MPLPDPSSSLRRALRWNAAFSAASASLMLVASGPLAAWLGLPDPRLVVAIGVGLVGFCALLLWVSFQQELPRLRAGGLVCSLADLAWVAGSAVVWGFGWLSAPGNWALVAVACVVLALGLTQLRALPPSAATELPPTARDTA